jgi:hypothetical protein
MKTIKLLASAFAALFVVGVGSAQAAPVLYNYSISGDVLVGDETFANVWSLTAGDVITASGSFTADLGTIGDETGTVTFGLGDSMTIDLLGGQFLTEADDIAGISLTFANGALTDFVFLSSGSDFNSNFTYFDDFDGMFGEWTDASLTVVPVPAAIWLFGSALGMLAWVRRKAA